jgi:hypothetical protein
MGTGAAVVEKQCVSAVESGPKALRGGQVRLSVPDALRHSRVRNSSGHRRHLLTGRRECLYERSADVAGRSRHYDHEQLPYHFTVFITPERARTLRAGVASLRPGDANTVDIVGTYRKVTMPKGSV